MVRSHIGVVEYNSETVARAPWEHSGPPDGPYRQPAPPDRRCCGGSSRGTFICLRLVVRNKLNKPDVDAQLLAMQALDGIRGRNRELVFACAVRDALYDSLLSGPRMALHLKVTAARAARARVSTTTRG
jgi:hypothetical protein